MDLNAIFDQIESNDVAALASLANTSTALRRALWSLPELQQLYAIAADRRIAIQLMQRILRNAEVSVDLSYENPLDTSFAIYLWILESTFRDLARLGAETVLKVPNCWWAHRVATEIFSEPWTRNKPHFSSVIKQGAFIPLITTPEEGERSILAGYIQSVIGGTKKLEFLVASPISGNTSGENPVEYPARSTQVSETKDVKS